MFKLLFPATFFLTADLYGFGSGVECLSFLHTGIDKSYTECTSDYQRQILEHSSDNLNEMVKL